MKAIEYFVQVTNRQILRWLRLWDECVFKRKTRVEVSGDEKEAEQFAMDDGNPRRPMHKVC